MIFVYLALAITITYCVSLLILTLFENLSLDRPFLGRPENGLIQFDQFVHKHPELRRAA